jgi:hypothetical protein
MRFIVMGMATKESEAGPPPKPEAFAAMQKYNEELVKAGVLLAAEGLTASSQGVRVKFSGDERIIVDGPFAESKEVIAGFTIIQVKSKEEAIEWVKRAPRNASLRRELRRMHWRSIARKLFRQASLSTPIRSLDLCRASAVDLRR